MSNEKWVILIKRRRKAYETNEGHANYAYAYHCFFAWSLLLTPNLNGFPCPAANSLRPLSVSQTLLTITATNKLCFPRLTFDRYVSTTTLCVTSSFQNLWELWDSTRPDRVTGGSCHRNLPSLAGKASRRGGSRRRMIWANSSSGAEITSSIPKWTDFGNLDIPILGSMHMICMDCY